MLTITTRTGVFTRTKSICTILLSASIACVIFLLPQLTTAQSANQTINFQGKIVNITDGTNIASGSPACIVAGSDTCDFRVNIYSDSVGGTLLWQETHSDIEIGDYEGIFNLSINSICNSWSSPSGSCSGTGFNWGDDPTIYLELQFDDDGNGDFTSAETFTRKLLSSVPYALYADQAGGVAGGLDTVYDNDVDKILNINDSLGLEFLSTTTGSISFDLQNTGDVVFQDNNSTFLTISDIGGLDLLLDSIDNPSFSVINDGTGTSIDITQNGNGTALGIDSSSTTSDTVNIDAGSTTTGDALQIIYDSNNLTSGYAFRLTDNSVDRFTIGDNGALDWLGGSGVNANLTTASGSEFINILIGSFKIGDGTPDLPLNGEDGYIEGTLEVDGNADFGGNVNFNNNQGLGFRIENLASEPTCDLASTGRIYHNTSNQGTYVCDGTNWIAIDTQLPAEVIGQFYDNAGGLELNVSTPAAIPFNQETRKDSGITHSNVTNNSRVTLDEADWYKVSYNISANNQEVSGTHLINIRCRVRVNGTTYLDPSTSYSTSQGGNSNNAEYQTNAGYIIFQTTGANDYYELMCDGVGDAVDADSTFTIAGESWTYVERIGGEPTTAGGSGGLVDLDTVYINDADKKLNVTNSAGLEFISASSGNIIFDLQSTGDFVIEDTGVSLFIVEDGGDIGIGLSDPSAKLHIQPSIASALRIEAYGAAAGQTGELQFAELTANGNNYVALKAADSLVSNVIWQLPSTDGSSGQVLQTDGAGNLSWVTVATGSITPSFGELYENSAGTSINVAVAGTFYQWVSTTVGNTAGAGLVTGNAANDNLTIGVNGAGNYNVSVSAAFQGTNNQNVTGAVFVNGVRQTNIEFINRLTSGSDIEAGSANGILNLSSGDVVDLRFTTSGGAVTVLRVNLTISRI